MATYYIDYAAGSDAAAGTSKAAAWKRHPYMVGFSGSYSHSAGDRFIFKGGATWPAACLPLTMTAGGSSSGNDYYGYDATWFSGAAWVRPILDGEYSKSMVIELGGGRSYVTIEQLELKRILAPTNYGYGIIAGGGGGNILIKGCYIHGWRTSASTDEAHGGVIFGWADPTVDTIVIDSTEIENSENLAVQQNGVCVRMVGVIRNGSRIHDNSSGVLYCLDFDGSYLYNITGTPFDLVPDPNAAYHTNGVYLDPTTLGKSYGTIRNSYFHDVSGGANMAYPNPRGGATVSVYNNVFWGVMSDQMAISIEPFQYVGEGQGTCLVFNNTIFNYDPVKVGVHVVYRAEKLGRVVIFNNHVINAAAVTDAAASNTVDISTGTNLAQTTATATSQGYVLGNLFAPATGGATIGAGTNESAYFTTDILGMVRVSPWDIGAYQFNSRPAATMTVGTANIGSINII